LRILVANHHRGLVGGLETYLQCVIPALDARGHEVALLYKAEAQDSNARIDSGGGCRLVWRVPEPGSNLPGELASWRPDVVYLHEPPDSECHKSLLDRFSVVMFAHSYYGACATGRKMHAFPQPVPCSRRCGPGCLILHYPRRCGGLSPITMVRGYRSQMANQALLGRHSAMAVASEHMRTEYLRHGVEPDRIHVLPLPPAGVDLDPDPPARSTSRDRLLFIGRLIDVKGVDYLLQALGPAQQALGRPLSLTVAGTGSEETKLRTLSRQMGLKVEFTGWLGLTERIRLMRENDLLVAPSLWPEPFGLVGIEAGCVGLPAVAYDVGGITEWLEAGRSGELAPGNPPTALGLADAIVRTLFDPGHYQSLSHGAWEVARRFTLAAHLDRLLPILERAATEGASVPR
jgi:glycosyltransferase involved in cell wall biosynthesis